MFSIRSAVIKEGDWVEVISLGPGFEHSYYDSPVISPVHRGHCEIRYEKLVEENNQQESLEEDVSMAKLR